MSKMNKTKVVKRNLKLSEISPDQWVLEYERSKIEGPREMAEMLMVWLKKKEPEWSKTHPELYI